MKKILILIMVMVISFSAVNVYALSNPGEGEELNRPNDSASVLKYTDIDRKLYTFYEAENAEIFDGATSNADHEGYSGKGAVALTCWIKNPDATPGIKFNVKAIVEGAQDIYIGYNNGHDWAQTATLTVNGKKSKLNFPTVEKDIWASYGMIKVNVTLKTGDNEVIIQLGREDYPASFNIDFVAVSKGDAWKDETKAIRLTIGNKTITKISENGETTVECDVAPVIREDLGLTFIPVRGVFDAAGADIYWNSVAKSVTVKTDKDTVIVTADKKRAEVNGKKTSMNGAPFIENGRTFIPLRFISENLGYNVDWDGTTQMITINIKNDGIKTISYYKGTQVPTYESVTGSSVISTEETKSGDLSYNYVYSSSGINQYEEVLKENGWKLINKEGTGAFTYMKDDEYVIIFATYSPGILEETNITPCKVKKKTYYDGTQVPTYESITGAMLKKTTKDKDGYSIYRYEYSKQDVKTYEDSLQSNGWKILMDDDGINTYIKGNDCVSILVSEKINECLVNPFKVDTSKEQTVTYYSGTEIPKYNSVTGAKLLGTAKLPNTNSTIYKYEYSSSEKTKYESKIKELGWKFFKENNDIYSYYKDTTLLMITKNGNEIWIVWGDVNDINDEDDSKKYSYYSGTKAPRYEDVTGAKLNGKNDSGKAVLYRYKYSSSQFKEYKKALKECGWNLESDSDSDRVYLYSRKGDTLLITFFDASGEIWITVSK